MRFYNRTVQAMDLSMTGWMQENPIVECVCTAVNPIDDMVIFPAGQVRDFVAADRAETVLRLPEMEQRTPPFQVSHHFGIKPFLEVSFPFLIEGI
jgi:hypothetical protein